MDNHGDIVGIVCVDQNWGIGKVDKDTGKGKLLFNLKQDMEFFTSITTNQVVVMGENTLLSLPGSKPLKNRINIVLCQEGHQYDNCICFHKLDDLIDFIQHFRAGGHDIFVIGGGMFYTAMLPYYDSVLVTKVDKIDNDATVFFPNLDTDCNFVVSTQSDTYTEDDTEFKIVVYTKYNYTDHDTILL